MGFPNRPTVPQKERGRTGPPPPPTNALDRLLEKLEYGSSTAQTITAKKGSQRLGTIFGKRLGDSLLKDYLGLRRSKDRQVFTRSLHLYPTLVADTKSSLPATPISRQTGHLKRVRKKPVSELTQGRPATRQRADVVLGWASPHKPHFALGRKTPSISLPHALRRMGLSSQAQTKNLPIREKGGAGLNH